MDFCKYKDALGKPGTGIHSLRIGGGRSRRYIDSLFNMHYYLLYFQLSVANSNDWNIFAWYNSSSLFLC